MAPAMRTWLALVIGFVLGAAAAIAVVIALWGVPERGEGDEERAYREGQRICDGEVADVAEAVGWYHELGRHSGDSRALRDAWIRGCIDARK